MRQRPRVLVPDKPGEGRTSRERRAPWVKSDSQVNEVLARYPATGDVFLQAGPFYVSQPNSPYAQYPEQTIAEYADRNRLDVEALLRRLNAEAEASEWTHGRQTSSERHRRRWAPDGPIGYTGAYVELERSSIEAEPVVARQLARGPY
jgi:hypothetical protein